MEAMAHLFHATFTRPARAAAPAGHGLRQRPDGRLPESLQHRQNGPGAKSLTSALVVVHAVAARLAGGAKASPCTRCIPGPVDTDMAASIPLPKTSPGRRSPARSSRASPKAARTFSPIRCRRASINPGARITRRSSASSRLKICSKRRAGSGPGARQSRAHHLMQRVDRLQRPHHHLEADDLALRVPADHVDAVDLDAVDRGRRIPAPRNSPRAIRRHSENARRPARRWRRSDISA